MREREAALMDGETMHSLRTVGAAISLPLPSLLTPADAQHLIYLLRQDRKTGVAVQLVAARGGEGTSTLARDLALIMARAPATRVLLVDAEAPGDRQSAWMRQRCRPGPAQPVREASAGTRTDLVRGDILVRAVAGRLSVTEMQGAESPDWHTVLPTLRSQFDLLVIDSPPLRRGFDGVLIAPLVDATLLVVEAQATRASTAQALRDRVLEVGGRIAGTVLNKRRYHVPRTLYERL